MITGQRSGTHGVRSMLDAAGRPVAHTDLDGELLAEFGYDPAGRLVAASTSTGTEHFLWDDTDCSPPRPRPRGPPASNATQTGSPSDSCSPTAPS